MSDQTVVQETSEATRQAYADLQAAVDRGVSESTLDRYRVMWHLAQLLDAGVVSYVTRSSGVGYIVNARGSRGERRYRTVRELEAFVHGAFAGLNR